MAVLAGARGFWPLEQPTVLRSSAKTTGRRDEVYQGRVAVGVAAQRRRQQGPAAALGGARGRGRCWASLALRSPWFDSWRCCGDATGSGEAQESPVVRNQAADHLPAAALRGNPGRCRCWGRAGRPRGRSWRRGEAAALLRWGWGQQSNAAAAAQRSGARRSCVVVVLRCRGGGCGMGGGPGCGCGAN